MNELLERYAKDNDEVIEDVLVLVIQDCYKRNEGKGFKENI